MEGIEDQLSEYDLLVRQQQFRRMSCRSRAMRIQANAPGPILGIAVGDGIGQLQAVAPLDAMGELQFSELAGGGGVAGAAGNPYCPLCGRGEANYDGDETTNSGLSE